MPSERMSPDFAFLLSLAFLAPSLVKAAVESRLPHGIGVARMLELHARNCGQRYGSAANRSRMVVFAIDGL